MHRNYESIKKAIAHNPQVKSVGGAHGSPVFVAWTDGLQANYGANKKNITIKCIPADSDFVRTLGIRIVAGSGFTTSDMYHLDTSQHNKNFRLSIMLNETAAKMMGWTPVEAVGATVEKGAPGIVKAVVGDFHIASFHEPIGPMLIFLDTTWINTMYIKVSGQDMPGTIAYLQQVWKEWVPYRPFEYNFLDEDYNALYKVETRTGRVFEVFAFTAILLACLGLFAMAAFTTVQRTKEIGIRKVLGATIWNVASLLSADFLRLVLLAAVLAIPLSWWAVHSWLQDFAYRIPIQWWVFAATGIAVLGIAVGTVSAQAIRAAMANPVKNLRTE
jgi:putative ABC transport system permease protein